METEPTSTSVEKKKEEEDQSSFTFKPIGKIVTCFTEKNGTPRQGLLCTMAKAILTVDFGVPNPQHSLEELEKYSHVWLLFVFHQNQNTGIKCKVSPPRLEGKRVGLFATRTPHRPNNIGLSIAKLDQIKGNTLYLSGVDLVSGTPILDVKPYIATYDSVPTATAPEWITEAPRPRLNSVKFTEQAEKQLKDLVPKLRFYKSYEEVCTAIEEVIVQDPRSVHFKDAWAEESFGFCIDVLNVICNFHGDLTATVTEAQDWSHKYTKDELPAPPSKRQKKLQEKRAKMNIEVTNKEKS